MNDLNKAVNAQQLLDMLSGLRIPLTYTTSDVKLVDQDGDAVRSVTFEVSQNPCENPLLRFRL